MFGLELLAGFNKQDVLRNLVYLEENVIVSFSGLKVKLCICCFTAATLTFWSQNGCNNQPTLQLLAVLRPGTEAETRAQQQVEVRWT